MIDNHVEHVRVVQEWIKNYNKRRVRMASPAKGKVVGFNFGDKSAYSSGGGLPEGDYIWTDLTVMMHQYTKLDGSPAGPARLGVMITLKPMGEGEDHTQFYPLGSKAHESWAPNPATGKGIVPIPGGPGTPPNNGTNWMVLLKSLWDSGLPEGIVQDDLSVLEGVWVHMANVPEPEERKSFKSKTGEAAGDDRVKMIPVVTEIKDDGKPWEGTGGIPEDKPAPKGKGTTAKPAATATTVKLASAKTTTATAPDKEEGGEEVETAAITGISEVLEKNPNGCPKLILRTGTFKSVKTAHGDELANAVMNKYFATDPALTGILSTLGYTLVGSQVKAA